MNVGGNGARYEIAGPKGGTMRLLRIAALGLAVTACSGAASPSSEGSPLGATVAPPTLSPTVPATAARLDIEVVESGFTNVGDDPPYAQYGVILENPNPSGWIGSYVTVTVAFYDEAGDVLTSSEDIVAAAVPGRFAVAGVAFDVAGAKSMEIDVDADWQEVDYQTGSFTPSKVKLTHGEYETRVTGVLKCTFDVDQENVEIIAILRDAKDRIVGGESTYVDKVRCDKGTPFSIETFGRLGKAKSAEVYPG